MRAAILDEISRLNALVEHLTADRIRISEEAKAEIARLTEERDAAKATGRLEGLEEAAKVAEGWFGYCVRFPPRFQNENAFNDGWPYVHGQSWCGEFALREAGYGDV